MKKAVALIFVCAMVLLTGFTSSLQTKRLMTPLPVYFKKNSTEYVPEQPGSASARQAIESIRQTLVNDPTIASVEIQGNCDSEEKNAVLLSQQRADKVKAALVKLGIDKGRVVAKGYGISRLRIAESEINKEPKASQKETLRALNRRCVYNILSWTDK